MLSEEEKGAYSHFTEKMWENLARGEKRGKTGWAGNMIIGLIHHLDSEVAEMKSAIMNAETPDKVSSECADIANMAMMVADEYRRKRAK